MWRKPVYFIGEILYTLLYRLQVDMILKDAWYHIYENVYFLDVRYNINNDVETIKYNHNIGADSDNESIDVISLKDHLQAKGYDYNKKKTV